MLELILFFALLPIYLLVGNYLGASVRDAQFFKQLIFLLLSAILTTLSILSTFSLVLIPVMLIAFYKELRHDGRSTAA